MSDDRKTSGGGGGVTARYTDMQRSGELLMGLSTVFLTDATIIRGYATNPDVLSSAVFAPVQALQVEAGLASTGITLTADAIEFGVLGTFLVGAVEAYELADQAIAAIETNLTNAATYCVGYALPGIVLIAGVQYLSLAGTTWTVDQIRGLFDSNYDPRSFSDILDNQNEVILALVDQTGLRDWLDHHPEIIDPFVRGAPGLVAGLTANPIGRLVLGTLNGLTGGNPPLTYEQVITSILASGSVFGLFDDGDITVHPTNKDDDEALNSGPPRIERLANLDDMFASLGEIDRYDYDKDPKVADYSRIRVIQSVGTDGVTRWIVQIPSTQSWDPSAGPALNDITACLVEMSGQPSALEAAVREAMQQAGVEKGDPVMLHGFSLGGITAGHMAADPSFTSQYNVQAVLTAGSPVARFDIGPDIQVLSFEHYDDPVPHMDGRNNPDRPNWTTITDTAPTVKNPYEDPKKPDDDYLSSDHNAFTYAKTAGDAQNDGGFSIDLYMDAVRPFLDGTQTINDFRAERVN
ncbi:MAG: hypothetical protein FWH11_10015 [Micrococcales bacterium]|nr:hypothetical protein [Micrococcales bacterium]